MSYLHCCNLSFLFHEGTFLYNPLFSLQHGKTILSNACTSRPGFMHNMQDSFVQCSTFGPDVICFRYWPVFLKKYKRQNIIKETLASVQLKKSCSKRLPSVHLDAVHTVIAQRLSEKNGCSFASSMHQNKGLFCVPFLKHVSSTEKCTNKQRMRLEWSERAGAG